MTCIVAIVSDNGSVVMGSDTAATNEDTMHIYKKTKIFKKTAPEASAEFLIGFSGSFRNAQVVEFDFEVPARPYGIGSMEYMVSYFVRDLRKTLKKAEALEVVNGVCSLDSELIVAHRGHLYTIMSDFHVAEMKQNYSCIGSGSQAALGALYALKEDGCYTAYDSAHIALEAAENSTTSVCGPFYIIETYC
jgi:ATP-dependent protease HslVU (ClpYQ) peptidase subunit